MNVRRIGIGLLVFNLAPWARGQLSCCCGDLVVRVELAGVEEDPTRYLIEQVQGRTDRYLFVPDTGAYDDIGVPHAPEPDHLTSGTLHLLERVGCGFVDTVSWTITDRRTEQRMCLTFIQPIAADEDVFTGLIPFTSGRFQFDQRVADRETRVLSTWVKFGAEEEQPLDLEPFRHGP